MSRATEGRTPRWPEDQWVGSNPSLITDASPESSSLTLVLPGSWWWERQRWSSWSSRTSRGGRKSELFSDLGLCSGNVWSRKTEWFRLLPASVWRRNRAVFVRGGGAWGGLGPVLGRQKGLSVLAVCCGNTAADSWGRQPVETFTPITSEEAETSCLHGNGRDRREVDRPTWGCSPDCCSLMRLCRIKSFQGDVLMQQVVGGAKDKTTPPLITDSLAEMWNFG